MTTTDATGTPRTYALGFVRHILDGFLDTLSDEQMLHQPVENGNHALWIAGHIALVDDMFRSMLGGGDPILPESWKELFNFGSTPTADAGAYPTPGEIRAALNDTREAFMQWINGLSPEQLHAPLPEDFQKFAPTLADLPGSVAAHEAMHTGQLSVVRKSLKMTPIFM